MRGILLAGGKGTRLETLTIATNKHLLPCGNWPMIFHPISQMLENGIEDICVVSGIHHLGNVVNVLGSGKAFGCRFTYKLQDESGGIAEALGLCRDFAGYDHVAVILGDNIFGEILNLNFTGEARLFLKQVSDPEQFGVAEIDHMKRLVDIEEKPKSPKSNFAVVGAYCYGPIIWNMLEKLKRSPRGELEISDLNRLLLKQYFVETHEIDGWWCDAGTPESLLKVNNEIFGNLNPKLISRLNKMAGAIC